MEILIDGDYWVARQLFITGNKIITNSGKTDYFDRPFTLESKGFGFNIEVKKTNGFICNYRGVNELEFTYDELRITNNSLNEFDSIPNNDIVAVVVEDAVGFALKFRGLIRDAR